MDTKPKHSKPACGSVHLQSVTCVLRFNTNICNFKPSTERKRVGGAEVGRD